MLHLVVVVVQYQDCLRQGKSTMNDCAISLRHRFAQGPCYVALLLGYRPLLIVCCALPVRYIFSFLAEVFSQGRNVQLEKVQLPLFCITSLNSIL